MKIKLPKVKKKAVIIAIILLLIIAVIVVFITGRKKTTDTQQSHTEYTVDRGDISVVITGSGAIRANEQYEITSLVTGDVLSSSFDEGDVVHEGDVLYQIDTENVQNSIDKAINSLESARMSYDDAVAEVDKLNVVSNCSGTVVSVYIKDGDSVSKGTKVADIVDDSIMILKIPFNSNDADNLNVGEPITVRLDGSTYELSGSISRISSGAIVSASGVSIKTVEVEVKNPGTLKSGDKAYAYTSHYACNESGTFEVYDERTITTEIAGDVNWIAIGVGDKVSDGQKVAELTSKSVTDSVKKNSLSYDDAQINLDNLYDGMEDYTITAPISGTVISKTTKAGDKLDNSNKSTVMAVIADMSRMLFDISVDELDIAKLKVGQTVSVTAEALEGKSFSGYIDKISIIGTTSNGVTTYPVTVVVNNPEGLIPGMNVDAEITVQESKDVLCVPISAIMRGNMVAVKTGSAQFAEDKPPEGMPNRKNDSIPEDFPGGDKAPAETKTPQEGNAPKNAGRAFGQSLPEGYELRRVEIGISNSDSVEIISGLEEGDIILVQKTDTSTTNRGMMIGGMHGGGIPGGGMHGGSIPGGSR